MENLKKSFAAEISNVQTKAAIFRRLVLLDSTPETSQRWAAAVEVGIDELGQILVVAFG